MLSDDSSTDSETGRFKSDSKPERSSTNYDSSRSLRRNEASSNSNRNNDKSFGKNFDRRNEDGSRFERRRSRERYDSSRHHSPPRRRYSRERSDRHRSYRDDSERTRNRDNWGKELKRSDDNNDRYNKKRSASPKPSQIIKRNFREEIKKNIVSNINAEKVKGELDKSPSTKDGFYERSKTHFSEKQPKIIKKTEAERIQPREKSESIEKEITRSKSRRYSEEDKEMSDTDTEQPASYYNLVPAKHESTHLIEESVHSVNDSSDDEEKLRAKLLNLEKQLDKTKKKKSKKSRKKSKSKHKDKDDPVEVSSTTDIQEVDLDVKNKDDAQTEAIEVSSTQTPIKKESSEEGEINSDDDSSNVPIDPSDLRHRLTKSTSSADPSSSPDLREKLKPKLEVAGPALPPHLLKKIDRSPTPEIEGPALPPHLQRNRNIGPIIPENMRAVLAESSHNQDDVHYSTSDDDGIGPLPAGAEDKWTDAHKKLEERALHIKINELEGSTSKCDAKTREEWMLELPEAKAKYIGLGPRQFRNKEAPDMTDRSSWTDTPQQKALKASGVMPAEEASTTTLQREAYEKYIAERDNNQEKAVKKHKKKHKRDESLLETHQRKLKKKKKKEEKEEGGKTRRPFDRNVDMQVNKFDDAQKKAIIKKAQLLDTRFSSGQAKFL